MARSRRRSTRQKALEIYERLGDLAQQAITLNNMGVIAKERSSWIESRDLYDRARVLFEAIGDRAEESVAKFNIAEILSDQGRYDEAEGSCARSIRVWRASGAETDVAEGRRELGKAIGRRGDIETALGSLSDARVTQLATTCRARSSPPIPGPPKSWSSPGGAPTRSP